MTKKTKRLSNILMALPVSTRTVIAVVGVMLVVSPFAEAQQGVQGKTAAEVYKNIQVLKDIPSTQLVPTMRWVATALGVECEYCHLGVRATDTPHKQIARKMIEMMLAIDKQNFGGQLEVTCFTCHRGNHTPVSAPVPTGQYSPEGSISFYKPTGTSTGAIDEVMAEAYKEETAKEQAVRAASLPKPEQVIAKYVAALGGEAALRKVTSRVVTSTTELSPNVRGAGPTVFVQETQYFKAPNLYMATLQRFSGPPYRQGL